jgi:tetratricopeptide (TPR) repeat protein
MRILPLLLALAPLAASAQGADTPAPPTPPPPSPEACEARDSTTAEINGREGVRLAKAGQFEEAVALFRIAVRLDACAPEHKLLLARGLARLEKFDDARNYYQQVIDGHPGTPSAARGVEELANMEVDARKAALPPMPPPIVTPAPPPPPPGPPWRTIGYATAGVGVVGLALGVVYGLDAQDADDQLQTAAQVDDRARYDTLVDQRDASGTLSWTFYGLGAALVAGGAVMAFVLPADGPTAQGETQAPVSLGPDANGGWQVQWQGQF